MSKNNETAAHSLPAEVHRSMPTPFLIKTYQLVDDSATDDIISWNEEGTTFIVWRPAEFARDLLPNCFKHNNFSSFVRQLNTYGFRKIIPDRWEFANEFFRRGEKLLLCDIHRRKNSQANVAVSANRPISPTMSGEEQGWSSISSPLPYPAESGGLLDENEKLRQQNTHLKSEVAQMKNICEDIFAFVSKHGNFSSENLKQLTSLSNDEGSLQMLKDSAAIHDGYQSKAVKALSSQANGGNINVKIELEDAADEESPKLFGVRLVSKKRSGDGEGKSQAHGNNSVKFVKVELGLDLSVKQEEAPWLKFCSTRNEKVCN